MSLLDNEYKHHRGRKSSLFLLLFFKIQILIQIVLIRKLLIVFSEEKTTN